MLKILKQVTGFLAVLHTLAHALLSAPVARRSRRRLLVRFCHWQFQIRSGKASSEGGLPKFSFTGLELVVANDRMDISKGHTYIHPSHHLSDWNQLGDIVPNDSKCVFEHVPGFFNL